MVKITAIVITEELIKISKKYNFFQRKKPYLVFNDRQKAICPISLEELEDGETCFKINCCAIVLKEKGLKHLAMERQYECPRCNTKIPLDLILNTLLSISPRVPRRRQQTGVAPLYPSGAFDSSSEEGDPFRAIRERSSPTPDLSYLLGS